MSNVISAIDCAFKEWVDSNHPDQTMFCVSTDEGNAPNVLMTKLEKTVRIRDVRVNARCAIEACDKFLRVKAGRNFWLFGEIEDMILDEVDDDDSFDTINKAVATINFDEDECAPECAKGLSGWDAMFTRLNHELENPNGGGWWFTDMKRDVIFI